VELFEGKILTQW